jgi:hypothetical protein
MTICSNSQDKINPTWASLPTVRVVRTPRGECFLVRIRCAHPWVLRKPVLVPEDVD